MTVDRLPTQLESRPEIAEFFGGRPVLVTGGLGFVGSNLVRCLVGLGAKVTVVDNLHQKYGGNLFNLDGITDRVESLAVDQADEKAMHGIVARFDTIFNMVGQVSHVDSMENPYLDLHTNVTTHVSLLEACRKHSPKAKILFAGTRGQYGRPQVSPVDETAPIAPIDVNGVNKHAGETYHFLYSQVYGLRVCSLRLTNTYGPRHTMKTARQGVFAWFVRQAIDGEEIKLFGGGEQLRDFNHVKDVVAALVMAMVSSQADGQVFNLGSHEPMSLLKIANIIVDKAGTGSVKGIPYPPHLKAIEIGDYIGDYTKIKNVLGWEPRIGLENGIAETVAYYQRNRTNYWEQVLYP
ncbi:MAG: GDP-mannose 4,6-dehydratase [Myxococcales bacterium]